ncbi:DUF58 domain-containing protein [Alteromonas aestuariivivens]|uniref:DUF58 domain-containing protein n=1 Tax=Alteromonas aestuariivivens TaxID=1938339 RepID=A0A3D8M6I9_9ALTE|nr:DUF58 domain-containing protein [Alteromonas aestuariivivens]RDV25276.1 DUF58 domain-containing protein [Alteromonas aestuariivivens]
MADTMDWLDELHTDGIHLGVSELLRYQQLNRMLDLTPKRTPLAHLSGAYLAKHKGRGMEFDEARHYQPGDDIRAIDWRVTARTGKTHTKIYREERERPVHILCDMTSSMQFGTQLLLKAVQAAHLASLISWAAAARGDKVGALLFNDWQHRECKPLSRKRAVLNICHELIGIQQQAQTQGNNTNPEVSSNDPERLFADACARLRRLAKPGSLVYLISDFNHFGELAQQHVSQLSRHCEIQALMVVDPLEMTLPATADVLPVNVTDGVQRQTWLLGDKSQQQRYQQWRSTHFSSVEKSFAKASVKLHQINAGLPLDTQLNAQRGFGS